MVRTRPRARAVPPLLVATAVLLATSCSRDGGDLSAPGSTVPTAATATTVPGGATVPATEPAADSTQIDPETTDGADATLVEIDPTTPQPSNLVVTLPQVSVAEVSEIGVPGLDSADAFCAAWSRFAGSFQVVAVTAAFGSGPPEQLAALEVAASPVVTDAYDALLANWPDELSSEADIVADQFLGPFARRLEVARDSLAEAGVTPDLADQIASAWVAGLAGRDPSTPEFAVDLSPDLWDIIDVAAADFTAQLVPFASDPSLVTNVQTPLTDEYLARSCPDQGTLSGQEVDTP